MIGPIICPGIPEFARNSAEHDSPLCILGPPRSLHSAHRQLHASETERTQALGYTMDKSSPPNNPLVTEKRPPTYDELREIDQATFSTVAALLDEGVQVRYFSGKEAHVGQLNSVLTLS